MPDRAQPKGPRRLIRSPEIWDSSSDVERIAFFSDAVFAIAMTLLIFQLSVPHGSLATLDQALAARAPKLFSFALSFLVLGQYWMAHHRIFRHVRKYDSGLMWLNLLYLLGVAFLPFPTALLGNYFHSGRAGLYYGLSLFVPSAIGSALWFYARRRELLDDVPEVTRRQIETRSVATPPLFLLGALAALINIYLAVSCWLILVPTTRLLAVARGGIPREGYS
ncbi:MAG TPA: TMEM175 family protein [Actinomycetota bacterium]|nr:TMEM175 family protein [Actinomycetota bacterium]